MATVESLDFLLVVAQRKSENKVIEAAVQAGAPGVTFFYGRGTGVRQKLGLLGHLIEAEKVILFIAMPSSVRSAVVKAVTEAGGLDKPGHGFLCLLKAERLP